MIDYPVVFRCSECAIEAPTLDLLESHIWSRHLRNFPYRCSLCGYPALKHSLLISHFHDEHFGAQVVEFKRKITDEVRLRDIIASSIVVLYEEEDDENVYEEQQAPVQQESHLHVHNNTMQVQCSMDSMQVMNSGQVHDSDNHMIESEQSVAGNMLFMDIKPTIHNYHTKMEIVQDHDKPIIHNYHTKMEIVQDHDKPIIHNYHTKMEIVQDHEGNPLEVIEEMPSHSQDIVLDPNALIEDDDGFTIYGGDEALDEYEYVDEEGVDIFHSDQYPTTSGHNRNIRMRLMKDRHLDFVVDHVAHPGKKRATTIWQCPDCNKLVRYPSRIEEHRRSHTGEKPFLCDICGQRFGQKGALKCHKRLHTGERPYACSWECGKTFVSASAQRMHEKHHTGERRHGCCYCGRLFTKRSHLIRHENAVHHALSIEPRRSQARGLDAAGAHEPILKGIVEGVLQQVQQDRFEKAMQKVTVLVR